MFENSIEKITNPMTNEPAKHNAIIDEEILKTLTDECRYFHDLIIHPISNNNAIIAIQVNKDLFTYAENLEIQIGKDDIIQFFSMAWLNSSWLQIYIM